MLRLMGLISPAGERAPLAAGRGFLILLALVFVLLAIGFGLAKLVALPFGGVGTLGAMLIGFVIIVAVLGVLTVLGRRRQAQLRRAAPGPEARAAGASRRTARLRPSAPSSVERGSEPAPVLARQLVIRRRAR